MSKMCKMCLGKINVNLPNRKHEQIYWLKRKSIISSDHNNFVPDHIKMNGKKFITGVR